MRTKERPQNVGEVYSSGRKELPAREAGLVYPPESALPSWGCDRGWRASATLRSRSTQEMDGGENKVDEMKVARPPVLVGPTTGHYLGARERSHKAGSGQEGEEGDPTAADAAGAEADRPDGQDDGWLPPV
eukprot:COSAG06_NODE_2446_length_6864_cov_26.056467_7_plen_131_part_00